MSDSAIKLRETYRAWLLARQVRYDEIVIMYGGNIHPEGNLELHKHIVKTLDDEQSGKTELLSVESDC